MNHTMSQPSSGNKSYVLILRLSLILILFSAIAFGGYKVVLYSKASAQGPHVSSQGGPAPEEKKVPVISDSVEYENKMAHITNGDTTGKWPVKADYPLDGALLPYKRIVSFYGNL